MRTVKPQKLVLLSRTFEQGTRSFLSLTLGAFFPLDDPSTLFSEASLWPIVGEELGANGVLDEGYPKQRGELLLSARAYPIGGKPQIACEVHVEVGSLRKTLRVVGDRHWNERGVPSSPVPFTEMPITHQQAYGGAGYPLNPSGKGFAPGAATRAQALPLPNVEDPRALVRSPKDRPVPAGFLPLPMGSPQRSARAGTYDAQWLKTRFPALADDLHPTYFNMAPEDQWMGGYFQGGERFVLEGMHPERPRIEGKLPHLAARAFVTQRTEAGPAIRELSTRLETVWLIPHRMQGLLLFRALLAGVEDDGADVLSCLGALENAARPRPTQHYLDALKRREDPETGHYHALADAELLPDDAGADEPLDLQPRSALHQALQRRAARERALGEAELRAAGLAPDPAATPELPALPTALSELPAYIGRMEAEVAAQRAAAEQEERELEAEARTGGPLLEPGTLDPGEVDPQLEATYRQSAHHLKPATRPAREAEQLRARVQARLQAGLPLAGEDLTGADLSGAVLSGLDLSRALLESANLAGADLRGSDLRRAVLAHADLTGALLDGALLEGANLGRAKLGKAQLVSTDLRGATLSGADLRGAVLRRAQLGDADLSEALLAGADLREAVLPGATFLMSDFTGANLAGADLSGCSFLECTVAGVNFTGARLAEAVFLQALGDGAVFCKASLDNVRCVQSCSFRKSDFRGASLVGANLRGAQLEGSDLSAATLDQADLSECDLRGARFYRAVARDARWVRADLQGAVMVSANLMNGIFQKANLEGVSFKGANLFRADLGKAKGRISSLEHALLTDVKLTRREAR